jgi:hypothetical protein
MKPIPTASTAALTKVYNKAGVWVYHWRKVKSYEQQELPLK